MPIRVLIVTSHSDLPETQQFIGLKAAGVYLEVMCPDEAPHRQKLIDAGISVHSQDLKSRFDKRGTQQIRQLLISGQFNIIHCFNNKAVSNGLRASKGLPVKFIAYRGIVGNVSFFDPMSWTTYLNPRVDKIICVANAIRDHFHNMRFLFWGLNKDKIITIYKGHDLSWYQAPAIPRAEWGIPEDAFLVGCTANERPRKGLPYLIEACKGLPTEANIHLLLIGNIQGKETLDNIKASPMKDRIHLTGFRRDAPQILASCNACILPALKREGLPKAIIEGMVYGVTPIVTDSGGSPELLQEGESGLIIPPASSKVISEAILQLYSDQDKSREMGKRAQLRIQSDFHTSTTISRTLEVYQELLD